MKRENTAKLDIIDMMRREGYDFMTAAEWADKIIAEFQASGRKSETYYCGKSGIKLIRNAAR